ncbi:Fc.00g008890.m01.CDS01 [Cosmosporella sp. VM-42]
MNPEPTVGRTGTAEAKAEAEALPPKRTKVFIACTFCKARKSRCDGGKPKCGNCVTRGVECNYSAVQKTRGPGFEESKVPSFQPTDIYSNSLNSERGHGVIAPAPVSTARLTSSPLRKPNPPQLTSSINWSQAEASIRNGSAIFPDFLLPEVYGENLSTLKSKIAGNDFNRRITPLLPQDISSRLIENSFNDVMAAHQLTWMDKSSFVTLLHTQYAASCVNPAGNPARWAIVNTFIALALRFKTAPGSEAELSDIPHSYYQNATTVIPDLILQTPSLISIQALLAMASFAQGIPDAPAFIMLASNASRQLELFGSMRLSERSPTTQEEEQYKHLCGTAHLLENNAIQGSSIHSISGGSKEEGRQL